MKALLISRDDHLQAQIASLCAAHAPTVEVTGASGVAQADQLMASEAPNLFIVDARALSGSEYSLLDALNLQYPQTTFMLLTEDQSAEALLRAMRSGVREVLPLPFDGKAFSEALTRVVQKLTASLHSGRVISFVSCKGGSGATFIATNFSYALATQAKKKVLLIDLHQQFGDAAMYVSEKKPTMTLSDVCAQINRIDAAFLESSLISVTPNFGILAASDDPTHAEEINPDHLDTILRLARNYYDFVVLDVGRNIDATTIRALDQSDVIYPVMQLAMPYVRDAGRLLGIFQSLGYRRDKTRIVVNRYEKNSELHLSDLEATLGSGPVYTMPNNYKAASDSINQGVPVLQLARSSPVSKSLVSMVDQLVGWKTAKEPGLVMRLFNSRVQASIAQG